MYAGAISDRLKYAQCALRGDRSGMDSQFTRDLRVYIKIYGKLQSYICILGIKIVGLQLHMRGKSSI